MTVLLKFNRTTQIPSTFVAVSPDSDLVQVAYQFGKFLQSLPSKSTTASQACKFVYEHFPSSQDVLGIRGGLRGLCIRTAHTSSLKVQHLVGLKFCPSIRLFLTRFHKNDFTYLVHIVYAHCFLKYFGMLCRISNSPFSTLFKLQYFTILLFLTTISFHFFQVCIESPLPYRPCQHKKLMISFWCLTVHIY